MSGYCEEIKGDGRDWSPFDRKPPQPEVAIAEVGDLNSARPRSCHVSFTETVSLKAESGPTYLTRPIWRA
jgi:hypothetical protein